MNRLRAILTLGLLAAVACAPACGGGGGGRAPATSTSTDQLPEITLQTIYQDINGKFVRAPSADGKLQPMPWVFDHNEPKEIKILDQKIEGDRGEFLVDMQTRSAPRAKNQFSLSGQLRLHYELESGLVLRQWQIRQVENVSFKYVKEGGGEEEKKTDGDDRGGGEPGAKPGTAANTNANANANSKSNEKAGANRNSPAR